MAGVWESTGVFSATGEWRILGFGVIYRANYESKAADLERERGYDIDSDDERIIGC